MGRQKELLTGALVLAALAGAAGCNGGSEPPETLDLAISPYDVAPGTEVLRCQEMALPSEIDVDVDEVLWDFSPGNHHVHVYVSAGEAAEASGAEGAAGEPYECLQAIDFEKWHLLAASQAGSGDWALPEGVAIGVRAGQRVLIQTHYLNVGSEGAVASGSVILRVARPGSVRRRAAAIFGQNRDIDVPPHTSGAVEGECALPASGELLAMTGHYHSHGRKFEAWVSPPGADREMIYETASSSHPVWQAYDGLRFRAQDRLGWSCQFDNDLEAPLSFGPLEDTQEHCNLFAFYAREEGDAEFLPCVIDADGP